ncbi:geranylgeranyl pyrophosphate synthetase [Grosmannia clavigera kw1407]|uniref:Geranylgeranyl pyrophosphate synthetase n=1 Tax=Grosmannia clavigera (strain kw1407 / UAMH 11150) TaxID=655863 RepID=F0XJR4_GROCL|nr:geranylgeranyl pyrophosphate synthetase [Grosmannia clavigera kw1407]EFX02251.1 geranylgeranyl pyrophosphate synthetase [Grosmannia clavigera kw1407]
MSQKVAQAQKTRKPRKPSPDAWMWKDVAANQSPLLSIKPAQLNPAATPVTSTSRTELVCSYNWLKGDKLAIVAPGFAPAWKPPPMPSTLPPDTGSFSIDHNGARMPRFPFEPLFRAATIVNPSFRFDEVDIVINRNSLRKLLDLCRGRVETGFRLELLLVGNTLVVQRCERKVRERLRGGNSKWMLAMRKTESRTKLAIADNGGLASPAATVVPAAGSTGSLLATHHGGRLQPQTTMAEIKSANERKTGAISKHMPQLWFGRTPWLLVGHHTDGIFRSVNVTHAAARFATWDANDTNQAALRTLAALLAQLRNDVLQRLRNNLGIGPGYAVAICEKQSKPRTIQIYAPTKGKKQALPDDLVRYFWSSPA